MDVLKVVLEVRLDPVLRLDVALGADVAAPEQLRRSRGSCRRWRRAPDDRLHVLAVEVRVLRILAGERRM